MPPCAIKSAWLSWAWITRNAILRRSLWLCDVRSGWQSCLKGAYVPISGLQSTQGSQILLIVNGVYLLPDEPDALRVPVRERETILCTSLE
jgi:hypothetical protein